MFLQSIAIKCAFCFRKYHLRNFSNIELILHLWNLQLLILELETNLHKADT